MKNTQKNYWRNAKQTTRMSHLLGVFLAVMVMMIAGEAKGQEHEGLSFDLSGINTFPSPNAASFAKVEEIPVDLYNGTASLTIPLHTFSTNKLSVPIALRYQSTGLKVQERASWVGLGWNLSAGGVITRVVRGKPDDMNNKGYMHTANDVNISTITASTSAGKDILEEIVRGDYDAEPDEFYISTPTVSGKMMFMEGEFRLLLKQKVKIEVDTTNYKITSWTITDENGIVYTFSKTEDTNTDTDTSYNGNEGGSTSYSVTSSWYLTKIDHPQSDEDIILEYTSEPYSSSQTTFTQGRSIYDNIGTPCSQVTTGLLESMTFITNHVTYLSKIKLSSNPNTYVAFAIDTTRSDQEDEASLSKITVYEDGNFITEHRFSYGTFSDALTHKRLRLDKVQRYTSSGVEAAPPHEFEYDTGNIPAYDSKAVDYWGYYNEATSNPHYVPTTSYQGSVIFTGANQDPSPNTKGMLKKVIYPTGGYTQFTYEGNDYSFVGSTPKTGQIAAGGMRIKEILMHDGISSSNDIKKSYSYDMDDGSGRSSGSISGEPNSVKEDESDVYDYDTNSYYQCPYKEILPTAFFQLGDFRGGEIGYKKVTETITSGPNSGKVVHHFEKIPYSKTANLVKKEVLQADDSLVSEEIKDYEKKIASVSTPTTFYSWTEGVDVERKIQVANSFEDTSYVNRWYSMFDQWVYLTSDTMKVYNGSTTPLETFTDYTYAADTTLGHNLFMQLTSKKETNSDGSERITRYRYAHQEESAMADSNMFSQLYSASVENSAGHILSKNWMEWSNTITGNSNWNMRAQWEWVGDGSINDTTAADTVNSEALKVMEVIEYDTYGNPLEVEDAKAVKTAYAWSDDKKVPVGVFNNASVDKIFAHSFAYDSLSGWTPYNFDESDTDFTISDGKLKLTNYAAASNNENDRIYYNHGSEITGNVVIEFDVQIANSNNYDLTIGAGGSSWGTANGGTENAIWTAITNESWKYHNGASTDYWKTIKSGLEVGKTYTFKIVAKTGSNTADFYINGEKHVTDGSFRYGSSGIQKIAFGNYGYGSVTTEWYIDNVRIYPEDAQATSREVDPVFQTPLAIKDASGSTNRFTFDNFGRLKEAYNANGERVSRNVYSFSLDSNTIYNANDPNRIETITYNDPADTTDQTLSVSYLDGLGRTIQSQTRAADGTAIITGTLYDEQGRPHITSRPIELDVSSYTNGYVNDLWGTGFTAGAGAALPTDSEIYQYYDSGFSGTTDAQYAYIQTQFEASPLSRPVANGNAAEALRITRNDTDRAYGLNSGTEDFSGFVDNQLSKTASTDPNGNRTFSFTDGWGNTIASLVDMNGDSAKSSTDLVTEFQYDLRNQLKKVTDPRGLETDYTYNQRGQLVDKAMPDKDDSDEYRYDVNGNLRFMQHANHKVDLTDESQSLTGGTSVTKTVPAGIRGKLSFSFSWVDLYLGNYTITIKRTEDNTVIYSNTLSSEWGSISTQTFDVEAGTYEFKGQAQDPGDIVSTAGTFAFKPYKFTYNNYDELNRITETGEYYGTTTFANMDESVDVTTSKVAMQKFHYGEASARTGANNTKARLAKAEYLDMNTNEWGITWYSYNTQGLVEWIIQDLPGSAMGEKKIEYVYDELGRVTEMSYQAGTASEDYYFRYSYDELGRLSKTESRDTPTGTWVQNAEYTYVADGQLSKLELGNNLENVDYVYGSQGWLEAINDPDSLGSDRFGQSMSYNHNGNISSITWNQSMNSGQKTYNYTYDRANRLTNANQSSGTNWDVNYTYDKSGNISVIQRRNDAGSINYAGGLFYFYRNSTTNRIASMEDYQLNPILPTYDANGNMTKSGHNGLESASYDSRNLPYTLEGTSMIYYVYDADGQRVSKKEGSTTTSYIRGADGQTIAVYENGSVDKWNILSGGEVIGTRAASSSFTEYFIKDHLGSTRAIENSINSPIAYFDFYPYGKLMPGRHTTSNDDRYKFTGHELDTEAGLDLSYAGARYLDSEIGTWLSIDPLADSYPGWSPFNYTMGDPINMIDPTGMASQAFATVVRNEDTGEEYEIDDGYDFVFTVSDVDFNRIKEKGNITDDLRGEWNAEFWRQVGQEIATLNGDTWIDKLLQFLLYDGIGEGLELGIDRNYYHAAFALTLGELKHLKRLKKWIKNNPGKKIPGTKKGGGIFKNREGKLPSTDSNGNPITYKEYDVNPTKAGANRDAQRMVVGSDGKTYYTKDHYNTFIEIKN